MSHIEGDIEKENINFNSPFNEFNLKVNTVPVLK